MRKVMIFGALAGVAALGFVLWPAEKPAKDDLPATAGAALVKVIVPDLDGAAVLGERAYLARCAQCHGANAAGQDGVAPPLVHKIYEPSHHGDGAFLVAALNGVRSHHWPFGDMPPVDGITEAEIKSIITYVRALQSANGIN